VKKMKRLARQMNRLLISSLFAVPLLFACSPQGGQDASGNGQSPGAPRIGAPTMDELVSLSYSGIYGESVTLTNGRWEGEPDMEGAASRPVVGLVTDFYLHGDLNGDGTNEAVVILWETSGGTGNNTYVAVVTRRDGSPVNIGTALIGDRVQLRTGRLQDGRIELDLVQQGPNDAACCPAETVTRVWELGADGLQEGAQQDTGRLSLTDVEGQKWLLEGIQRDEPLPDGLQVTLVFSNGRVSGHSACNRYFGSVTETGGPGEIRLSKLGSTRMACSPEAIELEGRYLQALQGVARFGFLNGKLVLTWQQDDSYHHMLFLPQDL
jgi:heat shock protein HslJ